MNNQCLSHSRYNCTYHIVLIPRYRRKAITIIKAATLPEHMHMYTSIPSKISVLKVVGRIKGKSSLILFDRHPEYRDRYNRHFWARGYCCEMIGNVDETMIKKYVKEQYERHRREGKPSK